MSATFVGTGLRTLELPSVLRERSLGIPLGHDEQLLEAAAGDACNEGDSLQHDQADGATRGREYGEPEGHGGDD